MTSNNERIVGQVKWFNNKSGYGFITVINGEQKDSDIFCHHTDISVGGSHYKYLVQGEYVEFNITSTDSEEHKYKATDITGMYRGKVMCEIKFTNIEARKPEINTTDEKIRKEWMVVKRRPSGRSKRSDAANTTNQENEAS